MKENINTNTKGAADVKSDKTILHTPNFFDAREVDVVRPGKKGIDWDDFMLMGESNKEEAEYINPNSDGTTKNKDKNVEMAVERVKLGTLGRKILAVINSEALDAETA